VSRIPANDLRTMPPLSSKVGDVQAAGLSLPNSAAPRSYYDSSAAAEIYPRYRQMELPLSSNANRCRHTPDASRDEVPTVEEGSSQTDG
jgi:hypothetical protein